MESEGKGGFGETLSDDPVSDGRPRYREFDAPVLGVCVVAGSSADEAAVAVLLRTGDIIVCDQDLQDVLERRPCPPGWPEPSPQSGSLHMTVVQNAATLPSATLLVQMLRPVLRDGDTGTRAKKRKGAATEDAAGQLPSAALTCVIFVYEASAAWKTQLPGHVAAVTVSASGEVGAVRDTGEIEVWKFERTSDSTRLAEHRSLRLIVAGRLTLRARTCTLYLDPHQPDVLLLVALSTEPTSSLVALLLNMKLARVVTSATIPIPAASHLAGRLTVFSTADDAVMILGLESGSRQSLHVQTVDVSTFSLTSAASFTDAEVRRLSELWLHPGSLDALEDKGLLEHIDRTTCAGVGEATAKVVAMWTEGRRVWTDQTAARANEAWKEWTRKWRSQRQVGEEKRARVRTSWSARRSTADRTPQVLSAGVVRILALACLSPFIDETTAQQVLDTAPYPSNIVDWLLRRGLLADSTLAPEGGLLAVLTRAGKWASHHDR